jgi:RNA polymerase sporulation-specific sigma factor
VATASPNQLVNTDSEQASSKPPTNTKARPEPEDIYLVVLAKQGRADATDKLVKRYQGFVRMKASSYFLVGGDSDDLIQEGMLGLYKAIRDFRDDRESSFRNFAELCVTRQIITAVKTATRNKHTPLNQYVSFAQSPSASSEVETTMEDILPGPSAADPVNQAISTEELASLVACLKGSLSDMESSVLAFYLEDRSYEEVAMLLGCDTKTVDNALQRVKRKITRHIATREAA